MATLDFEPIPMEVDEEPITPVKPYKKKTIPKTLKMQIWNHYIGKEKGIAKCMCCNANEIMQAHFEAGHVISERDGGSTNIQNLRPICSLCNKSMRTKNMLDFMRECGYKTPKNWNRSQEIITIE